MDADRAFRLTHYIACGMAIGLYLAKGTNFLGVDVTPSVETIGMTSGGALALALKIIHLA